MLPTPCALVTGGARRVGRAIAIKLAGLGYDVAITYRNSQSQADELVKLLQSQGRRAIALEADFSQEGAAGYVAKQTLSRFGRLDCLVNNASTFVSGSLPQCTVVQMRECFAIHVEAPMLLCQLLADPLRAAHGHIINMVDLLAEKPWPRYLAYCASKAALLNMTYALARELAPEVTVNAISPGVVDWPDDFPQSEREAYLKQVPLSRAGTPDDVASAVAFLCTSAPYMTGQVLRIDGGRSLR